MCAPVILGEVRPLNVALICSVWAVGSSTIVARPVPGEGTGVGSSLAPERLAVKVIGIALAAGAGSIRAAAKASRQDRIEMWGSDSFMFASLAARCLGDFPPPSPRIKKTGRPRQPIERIM